MGKIHLKESPITRHIGEEFAYKFDLTDKVPSGTHANPANTIHLQGSDGSFGDDLSGTLLTGTATISSSVFTSQSFVADAATAGKRYKMLFSLDIDGDAWYWILFVDMVS